MPGGSSLRRKSLSRNDFAIGFCSYSDIAALHNDDCSGAGPWLDLRRWRTPGGRIRIPRVDLARLKAAVFASPASLRRKIRGYASFAGLAEARNDRVREKRISPEVR
jgi:hypothetical protein